MNKVKYIIQLLMLVAFCSCQEEELFKNKEAIRVMAGFANTRTSFTEDDGTVHVAWNAEDEIGLFTNEQSNLRYKAVKGGDKTEFIATSGKLKVGEQETVFAYYPFVDEWGEGFAKLPNLRWQYYKNEVTDLDFIYAKNCVSNNELLLEFKHLFAFLKITVPLDMVINKGEGGLSISCSEYICVHNATFDFDKQEIISGKGYDLAYIVPQDVVPNEKGEITCYIAILPIKENVELKVYSIDSEQQMVDCLLTKNTPLGGFKAGNVYTLYLNENESEVIRAKERDALIAFYKATGGDRWTRNDNWCSDKPVDEWYGVETSQGLVRKLCLNRNSLTGKIPVEIYQLEALQELDLGSNNLTGVIPEEIGNLRNLWEFRIWENRIGGTLPDAICNLTNLGSFYCSGNPITGTIPKNIGNLKKLFEFYMESTEIGGEIPESFYELRELKYFYASNMNLSANPITGTISSKIGNLVNLIDFEVRDQQLSGPIPSEIGSLKNLSNLHLSGNQLSGSIPPEIGNLKKLKTLHLSGNQLTGVLPPEIGGLTSLQVLELGKNLITGVIPMEIGNLQNLEEIHFNRGLFSGAIPPEIGRLEKLRNLSISNNLLSGEIPSQIGNMSNLNWIDLHTNQLTGSLPSEMGKLKNLTYVALSNNKLSGEVPESVAQLPCWQYMWWNILGYNNIYIPLDKGLVPGPLFNVVDIDGNFINSQTEYAKNKYTILFQWAKPSSCFYSEDFIPTLITLWEKYRKRGLGVIGWNPEYDDINSIRAYITKNKIPWMNFRSTQENGFGGNNYFPESLVNRINMVITINVVDSYGHIVFSSATEDYKNLSSFIAKQFGETSIYYESTDYSEDGKVVILQEATVGKGIDLVFMGEGFIDKDMNVGGKYEQKMVAAMEQFFSIEPYKSFRNRFNIYIVKAISPNAEFAEDAKNAFNQDIAKCFAYAAKVPYVNTDRLMVNVIYNTSIPVGRSYTVTAMNDGSYVAFMMEGVNEVINHESGGHGVAKLLDEYVEFGNEQLVLPEEDKLYLDEVMRKDWGWGANVDYHSSASEIKWAYLLGDNRYRSEVGIYEGAYLYGFGAYRPSISSMMNDNILWFNAPSREAIYKAIMTMSEGNSWTYDFEEFAAYDVINRGITPVTRTTLDTDGRKREKRHLPPAIIRGTWRDVVKKRVVVPLRQRDD